MSAIRPVFLLSLPRSGSTLLQRMLGAHPAISTHAEPWLLLPLFAALDRRGTYSWYNHRVAQHALTSFADHLPQGEDSILAQIRAFASNLYDQAADEGAAVFLDKTPRYGLYVQTLLRTFPTATIIVLWRNPLAVLTSLSHSWLDDKWMPYLHAVDLYDLLERLVNAVDEHPDRFHQLQYEELVRDPDGQVKLLLAHLDLPWHDGLSKDFARTDVGGPVGDDSGTLSDQREVSAAAAERWRDAFSSPVRRWWAMRYLDWIGPDRLRIMGYDHAALRAHLERSPTRWATVPSDLAFSAKGLAWRVIEPQVLKDKWARRDTLFRMTSHG